MLTASRAVGTRLAAATRGDPVRERRARKCDAHDAGDNAHLLRRVDVISDVAAQLLPRGTLLGGERAQAATIVIPVLGRTLAQEERDTTRDAGGGPHPGERPSQTRGRPETLRLGGRAAGFVG